MQRVILVLVTAFLSFPLFSEAAGLPGSANLDFRVINISMDNQNAESAGVRPGDVLRYEVELSSNQEDIVDYTARVDISELADHVELVDLGLGSREGNWIVYPPYSHSAPCRQIFTFFARFKGCQGNVAQLRSQVEGQSTLVPTTCEGGSAPTKLPSSGPALWTLAALFMMVVIFFAHQVQQNKST